MHFLVAFLSSYQSLSTWTPLLRSAVPAPLHSATLKQRHSKMLVYFAMALFLATSTTAHGYKHKQAHMPSNHNATRKKGAKIPVTDDSHMVVPLLDLPLESLDTAMLLDSSDPHLLNELRFHAQSAPFAVYLGLNPGHSGQLKLNLNVSNTTYSKLFSHPKLNLNVSHSSNSEFNEISPELDGRCSPITMLIVRSVAFLLCRSIHLVKQQVAGRMVHW